MSPPLAAVIADLTRDLPPGCVADWARILRSVSLPGPGVEATLIEATPGPVAAAKVERFATAWRTGRPPLPGAAVALALEVGAASYAEQHARQTDVMVSGPVSLGADTAVRLTGSVITEVIRGSERSLLVVSFAAFGVAAVLAELERAVHRGVRIDLVLESGRADGGTLRGTGAEAAFASLGGAVTFWSWPAPRRPMVRGARAAMHAKLVAADERVAVLGSANLTDRALAHNIELGVAVRDPDAVGRIVRHFRSLMRPGEGPLEPVPRASRPRS
ncbi:DISARM system phospholipase D-like protein DrmC [Actinomadura rugatobispora]|uniref:DISARM system phospholipase D-like protein DrmC n=1 Tax=Actinomadura rugatobispora TaxID=1994 RepID=A0ABW1ADJ4_9ACTN|nr:hypothetical protein GCM10010200_075820 [Actinomadura rugatobispora]